MSFIELEVRSKERVGLMTFNYERENRFHPDFIDEMATTLDAIEENDAIRAVVVTGADPKFFSNGLDLEWLMAHVGDPRAIVGYLAKVNAIFERWTLFPKPTVAALNGHTFAAGLFLAAHMDFRLMREDRGWICTPEVDINIPLLPGMIAICQAVLPPASFHRLYYTGGRFTGPEALAMGFVESIHPADELVPAAVELAEKLGRKSTKTYAEMKRRVRADIARILREDDPELFETTLAFALG